MSLWDSCYGTGSITARPVPSSHNEALFFLKEMFLSSSFEKHQPPSFSISPSPEKGPLLSPCPPSN